MRPSHSTTVAPSFPWFNLSSAVYEVPHRTSSSPTSATFATSLVPSPTPVPVFLTSRPTEETPSSATPPAPQLVVVATERVPIEVNIMATSQEHGDNEETASIQEQASSSSSIPGTSSQDDNSVAIQTPQELESSSTTDDKPVAEIVPSTPILPPGDSTTLFFAPAIAISILPSPVEPIMVTQEASLLGSQFILSGQNETENIAPIVEPGEGSTQLDTASVAPALVEVEVDLPTTQTPVVAIAEPEVDLEHIQIVEDVVTSTTDPITSAPIVSDTSETVEATTAGYQQQVEIIASDAVAPISEYTTIQPQEEVSPVANNAFKPDIQIPSIVLTPPDKESGGIVENIETVTATPSSDIHPPNIEIQPPTVEFDTLSNPDLISDDSIQEVSTVSPSDVDEKNIVATTIASEYDPDQVQDAVNPPYDPVTSLPTNTEPPALGNLEVAEAEVPTFDELPQNTETETVTDEITVQEVTTQQSYPVLPTSPSTDLHELPIASNDEPQSYEGVTAETATLNPNQDVNKPISVPATSTSGPVEKETMPLDDAIHISAATEEEVESSINSDHGVTHDSPVLEQSNPETPENTIPHVHPSTNEVNSINVDTFEIIPPQNDAENTIEIQNQVMDGHLIHPTIPVADSPANNEVDAQSDRNSDDDTIEIFASNYHANHSDSHVSPETPTTQLPPIVEQVPAEDVTPQDDSITVVAAPAEDDDEHLGSEDDHEEIMHPDDQHGSSDSLTTEYPVEESSSSSAVQKGVGEEEISQNDDHVSENVVTTQLPSEHINDDTASDDDEQSIVHTTVSTSSTDSEVPSHDQQIEERTTISPAAADDEDKPQNDAIESDSIATTFPPTSAITTKAEKVADPVKIDEVADTPPKFRLDLSAFDHSGEIESREVTANSEVVFDEGVQPTTNAPHLNSETDTKIRDDPEVATPSPVTGDGQKLRQDSSDIDKDFTTQKYVSDGINQEVEPIQNFEFDEVSLPATTNRPSASRSELDDAPSATTIFPESHQLRNVETELTTLITPTRIDDVEGSNDFVEVSTNSPSGFETEYRGEELQDSHTTLAPSSAFKSDVETTLATPVFLEEEVKVEDDVGVTTFSTIHDDPQNAELGKDDLVTTVESVLHDDDDSTISPTVISNPNATTPRIISIDTMMIPEKGVSIPSVSDDIVRFRNDLGRSDISPREGENDSWFVQTATKNRQMQGLFPSSRSQKRLFRSRTPRDTSNAGSTSKDDSLDKNKFKKYKKVISQDSPKKLYFSSFKF